MDTADKCLAVVGAVVPDDLVGGGPPLQPGALLPVPGGCFPDPSPLVLVVETDKANVGMIAGAHVAILKIDSHSQQVASCNVKLKTLVKEETCVKRVSGRSGIGDSGEDRIPRSARLHHLAEARAGRVGVLGLRWGRGISACGGCAARVEDQHRSGQKKQRLRAHSLTGSSRMAGAGSNQGGAVLSGKPQHEKCPNLFRVRCPLTLRRQPGSA